MADADLRRVTRERDDAVRARDTYRQAWHDKSALAELLAGQVRDALVQREHWEREAIAQGDRCAIAEAQLAAYGPGPVLQLDPATAATRPPEPRTPASGDPAVSGPLPGPHTAAQAITPTEHT